MRKFFLIMPLMLFVVSNQKSYSQFKTIEILTNAIIYTKDDTIKCFMPMSESYSGKIKYKINKEDKKFLKIKTSEVLILNGGGYKFSELKFQSGIAA